jgi:hypothetical protein
MGSEPTHFEGAKRTCCSVGAPPTNVRCGAACQPDILRRHQLSVRFSSFGVEAGLTFRVTSLVTCVQATRF